MAFNHENLKVYQRTLSLNAKVGSWIGEWDSRHAICDHLPRAAGSILENIAMASAAYSAMKVKSLDYAIGSALECAACLDLAGIKQLLDVSRILPGKDELLQILRMLVGLRRSWSSHVVKEEQAEYLVGDHDMDCGKSRDEGVEEAVFFNHEKLDVYSIALEAAKVFSSSEAVQHLSSDIFRKLDALLTSMVLNIAEGNGRFCAADQGRFLGTSNEAAIKMAARLDLCAIQGLIPANEIQRCKVLLSRVSVMTVSMIRGIRR